MFKNASKNACTSTIGVSADPLSPTPSISSAVKTDEDRDDPKPADEGDIQM
jgi:hypothetical protein